MQVGESRADITEGNREIIGGGRIGMPKPEDVIVAENPEY